MPRLVRLVTQKTKKCRLRCGVSRKAYYFHRFYDFQPDLNTFNTEVQAEILKIMGFLLQLGVSVSGWMPFHSSLRKKAQTSPGPPNNTTCCERLANSSPGEKERRSSLPRRMSCRTRI